MFQKQYLSQQDTDLSPCPSVEQMYEEFYLWMEGEDSDSRLKFQPSIQLRGVYDIWKKQHKAPFRSFDEFIDKALENIEIRE